MNNKNTTAALNELPLDMQLQVIQDERRQARSKRFSRSRLDPYRVQLEMLRFRYKASFKDLQLWLQRVKRVKVTKGAVVQRFKHWAKDYPQDHEQNTKASDQASQGIFEGTLPCAGDIASSCQTTKRQHAAHSQHPHL